jgi:uncharacterized protein
MFPAMQTNILWAGREYYSLENCLINTTASGNVIQSTIIGRYENKLYKVDYQIKTNQQWETLFAELKSQHSNERKHIILDSDGKGNWYLNGKAAAQFNGCIDVDIPLTPFTNTLPIKRLNWVSGEAQQIAVVYLDLLENQIRVVKQKYAQISPTTFHYENVPNDFEATITVDDNGFVVDYPELFERSALLNTAYHMDS